MNTHHRSALALLIALVAGGACLAPGDDRDADSTNGSPTSDAGGTNQGGGGDDGSPQKTIFASDYDASCEVDFDCETVWVGGDVCECSGCGPITAINKESAAEYRDRLWALREACTMREACGSLEDERTIHQASTCAVEYVGICISGQCEARALDEYRSTASSHAIVRTDEGWVTVDIETNEAVEHDDASIPDVAGEDWDVSPDGEWIVYAQPGVADALLVLGPSDFSSAPVPIFGNPELTGVDVHSPVFAWNGTRVLFLAGTSVTEVTAWSIGIETGVDQRPTSFGPALPAGQGFQTLGAKWSPGSYEVLSKMGTCGDDPCPTHVGILDISGDETKLTQISGDSDGWTLAQMANEPSCNGEACNVVAENGGATGARDFGWVLGSIAVYRSNRDVWNDWDGSAVVPHGMERLLSYSVHYPEPFESQTLERQIGAGAPWDLPGIPRISRNNIGEFVTFVPDDEGAGIRVYAHRGMLRVEHTDSFSATNRPRSVRLVPGN